MSAPVHNPRVGESGAERAAAEVAGPMGALVPYVTRCHDGVPLNAMTVDLEDWGRGALSPEAPLTPRVLKNTERLLGLLAEHRVRATFFASGQVCEQFPELLRLVMAGGHEIGTHGYEHQLVHRIGPERFRDDLQRSIEIIGAQTGRRPIGYRAPGFSILRSSLWAGPILAEHGIRYSSSIFPIAGSRYGIPDAPRFPYRWPDCDLIEFPLTTVRGLGRNWPVAGGGYFRLIPSFLLIRALRTAARAAQPFVVYMHPYELDVRELAELRQAGWTISSKVYIKQSLFRGRMAGRLAAVFRQFPLAPMAEVLGLA